MITSSNVYFIILLLPLLLFISISPTLGHLWLILTRFCLYLCLLSAYLFLLIGQHLSGHIQPDFSLTGQCVPAHGGWFLCSSVLIRAPFSDRISRTVMGTRFLFFPSSSFCPQCWRCSSSTAKDVFQCARCVVLFQKCVSLSPLSPDHKCCVA